MMLKAFAVLEKDEFTGNIYFAEKAIYAAKAGANEFADGELGGVQCRRAPWADRYAETGVPARLAVEYGWHFECMGCGTTIDSDLPYENGLPVSGVCGTVNGRVFCSPRCKWKYTLRETKRRAQESQAICEFKDFVRRRFPDADFCDDAAWSHGHHAYCTQGPRGGWHREQVVIAFNFPGMKIAPAHFRMEQCHKMGPPRGYYTCCNGDREAFEAFAEQQKLKARHERGAVS